MARFTTARAASHGHRGRPTSSPGASAKSNTPIAWGPRRATKPISGPTERGAPRSAPSITRVHKPATLGAGLTDSPAGLAAWISEKVVAWSSTGADGSPAFDRNLLLETLTLYWVTETISTSLLPYWAARRGTSAGLPVDDPCPVPGAHCRHRLRRRARPIPETTAVPGRAVLLSVRVGRAPARRSLPRLRRTRTACQHSPPGPPVPATRPVTGSATGQSTVPVSATYRCQNRGNYPLRVTRSPAGAAMPGPCRKPIIATTRGT